MTDYKLYSFDIFDTLVTRTVAKPDGIFVLMQNTINKNPDFADLPSDVKENFYNYRKNAEHYQRRIKISLRDFSDITLDIIYEHIKNTFFLTAEQAERLKQLEIETELNNTIGIQSNIEKLKQLYNSGKRVILISDMYLPKEVVEQILVNIDPVFKDIKLYLSSDIGFMKAQGEMYKYVKEQENIDYKEWCHTGDNKVIDIKIAKQLGIQTKLYKYVGFKNYEKQLLDKGYFSPYVQLAIGTSRNLRLNCFKNNEKAQLGASLTANILYPYVTWVLNSAANCGIKHLFFIARDGYIPQKIANEIIKIRGFDITTSYLYGSKKSWRNAGLDLNDKFIKDAYIRTLSWNTNKTETICELSEKQVKKILPKEYQDYKKGYAEEKELQFRDYLTKNDELLQAVVDNSSQKRNNAIGYLKQEYEQCKTNKFAFVEFDGSGLTNSCMGNLFKTIIDKKFDAFYLASTNGAFESNTINFHYFYALKKGLQGHVLEIITRAPHGQTLGYQYCNDKWKPILEEIDTQTFDDWKFDEYINGIIEFTKHFTELLLKNRSVCMSEQTVMSNYIKFITEEVDKETANQLGNVRNQLYGNESRTEFAPKINLLSGLIFFFTGKIKSENIMYSAQRSSKFVKSILLMKQKQLLRRKRKYAHKVKYNRIKGLR